MKYCHILFLLFNIFSIFINISSEHPVKGNKLTIASRYIEFSGKTGKQVSENSSGSSYIFYFYAEITGFTKDYSFIMYTPNTEYQRYSYMTCKVPASTADPSSYVQCIFDLEKFYLLGLTVELPNQFPSIEDCQVSYWEKVEKSHYYGWQTMGRMISYDKELRFSSITEPLCYSNTQNIIKTTGVLYDHQSSQFIEKCSLSVPAFVDGKETKLDCSLSYIKNSKWEYNCIVTGGKKLTAFYTIVHYSNLKFLIKLNRDFNLINCKNPDRLIRFLDVSTLCPSTTQ